MNNFKCLKCVCVFVLFFFNLFSCRYLKYLVFRTAIAFNYFESYEVNIQLNNVFIHLQNC